MSETTGNIEKQKAKALKTLATMFDYLSLEARLKVADKGSKIAITISSEDAGRIIGRKGQILESFQTILNRMMYNNDQTFPRVVLDIDGYPRSRGNSARDGEFAPRRGRRGNYGNGERERGERGERGEQRRKNDRYERNDRYGRNGRGSRGFDEETLKKQALDAAKEVKRWGDPTTLPKMNAHERRIIHITLEGDNEIITTSEGDGNLKNVIISLKK